MKRSFELGKKKKKDSKIKKGNLRDYFHASPIRKSFKTVVLSEKIIQIEKEELEKNKDQKIKLKKNKSEEEENSNDFNIFDFLKDNIKQEESEIELEKDEKKKFLNLADFREHQKEIIIYSKKDFAWFFENINKIESPIKNLTNYYYLNSFLLNNSFGLSKRKNTLQSKSSTNNFFSNKLSSNGFSNISSSNFENFYESFLSIFWKFKTEKNMEFFFINSIFDLFGFSNAKILKEILSKSKIEKDFKNKNKNFLHLKIKNNKSGLIEKLLKNKKDWIFLKKKDIEESEEYLITEEHINFFIQEIFNVFNEKQFYFEIYSNYEFQNAIFKNMDFSRDIGDRGFFGNNFYYSLSKNLLTDSKKYILKKKQEFIKNKEFLQNVGNEDSYHYIELNGSFYGIRFFKLLRYFYSNNNDCKILFNNN